MNKHTLLNIALVGIGFLSPLQARDITWSNEVGDALYDSQGNSLSSSFLFEIGTFINGFTPTGSNINDWAANWIVFDRTDLNLEESFPGSGLPANYFASSAFVQPNNQSTSLYATPGATFAFNAQAYLWVYNSKTISFTSEWALVTDLISADNIGGDAWRFPFPIPENMLPPLTWSLAHAETAIFGAVQDGASRGSGDYTASPSTFSLQTHQVPEPGSALLIASAGLFLVLRRSRFLGLTH